MISAEMAREILSYDQETGEFVWRIKPSLGVNIGDSAGCVSKAHGYRDISVKRHLYKAHRLAWLMTYGRWPEYAIDHINGVRSDNRICNLRDVPRLINNQNVPSTPRSDSTTGLRGVTKIGKYNRWKAQISNMGRQTVLGIYGTPELAHDAYMRARHALHVCCER